MGATKEDTEDFHFIFNEMERMNALLQDSHEKYYADFDNKLDHITACINTPRDIYKKARMIITFNYICHLKHKTS